MASKSITIEHNEKKYKLEFTKDTVRSTERRGFEINKVLDFPAVNIPLLVHGAFLANHKWLSQDMVDEIYESIPEQSEFINKLIEMYNEPLMEMMGLGEGADKGKKSKWEATF